MDLSNSKIILLSHISDLSGPTEALEEYLNEKRVRNLFLVYNPLEYCRINKRKVRLYREGQLHKEIRPPNFKFGRIFTWFFDCLADVYYPLKVNYKCDMAICCDALNSIVGLFLKRLGKCKMVIFYVIDWTPVRFENKLLNNIYQGINNFCLKNVDYIWCVSERLAGLYRDRGIGSNRIIYTPVGVSVSKNKVLNEDVEYKTLVFLGALEKTKGIDILVEAWPELVKKDSGYKLVIIGKTPGNSNYYENIFKDMPNVSVLGILTHIDVLKILPKYGVGLAPYKPDSSSVSFYGDPSRIKDYLACGLPVLVTSVPEIAGKIMDNHAGRIIEYTTESLINGIIELTGSKEVYFSYRGNVIKFAEKYTWDRIFDDSFKEVYDRF